MNCRQNRLFAISSISSFKTSTRRGFALGIFYGMWQKVFAPMESFGGVEATTKKGAQLPHFAQIGTVYVGGVGERGDLVHLLAEAQGQLARHGAGKGQAKRTPCGDIDGRIERVTLWNGYRQTFGVNSVFGITFFAF